MSPTAFDEAADLTELVEPACGLAQRWLEPARGESPLAERRAAAQLSGLVRDRGGSDISIRFVDGVVRPESLAVAARGLGRLTGDTSAFLSPADRALLSFSAALASAAPGPIVRLARQRWRQLIAHLVFDSDPASITRHLRDARRNGFRLNFNVLGGTVLGDRAARDRVARTRALLDIPGVDHVSLNMAALAPRTAYWDMPDTVSRAIGRLRPLFSTANAKKAFVNLDIEEYRDLDLAIEVFTDILSEPEFLHLSAGLTLLAYLPDSREALDRIIAFAQRRHEAGGAPIKVRLVKGANLAMERVEAELRGWALAPFATKEETDANFLALLDRAMSSDHGPGFHVGIGTHNLFDMALGYLLARGRGVADRVHIELLQGWAPERMGALRDMVGSVILYTPVAPKEHFELAAAYIIRRLEENAQPENFLHALFRDRVADQERRFRAAVHAMRTVSTTPRRSPNRPPAPPKFANTTDSDPALAAVRDWAARLVADDPGPVRSAPVANQDELAEAVARGRAAGREWGARTPQERATILRRVADAIEARRGELITALVHEGCKTVGGADTEVSEAVDFARWFADRAADLGADPLLSDGATFTPHALTVVIPPWTFPVAIPASGVLANLAAGSAVVIDPARPVARCTEILLDAVWAAGVPQEAAQVIRINDSELELGLIAHPGVDGVVFAGAPEPAQRFIEARSGRMGGHGVVAESAGQNALIITDAADFDLAIADLVRSAFGNAGQNGSAASLAILVGDVANSSHFREQLLDAVSSLVAGWPGDPGVTMGPLIAQPDPPLRRALTQLDPGESWLIRPRSLDESGRLWSPGVREGVRPGSWFHCTQFLGPVLGLMHADTLDEAIRWQNDVASGLSGGLHSLDLDEIKHWLGHVEVGNAYVNRPITGSIVGRQPFGGWKTSVVGTGAKISGFDYAHQFGTWSENGLPQQGADVEGALSSALGDFRTMLDDPEDREWLEAAARSDAFVWSELLGRPLDLAGLSMEQNELRWVPAPLVIRCLAGARLAEVLRVVLAARRAETPVDVSVAPAAGLAERLTGWAWLPVVRVESEDEFATRFDGERIRVVGPPDEARLAADRFSRPGVIALGGPVLANGRRELLSVVREQTVSRTRHRHGHLLNQDT